MNNYSLILEARKEVGFMALTWKYSERAGHITFKDGTVYPWYEGNALMICNREERTETEINAWLVFFFANEDHAKNCLGLTRGNENIFSDNPMVCVTIHPQYCRQWAKVCKLLLKAFPDIKILLDQTEDREVD